VVVLVGFTLTAQAAWAEVSVGHTNLTIHVKGSSVTGKLVGKPACRPNQKIDLLIDGVSQTSTMTDSAGNYAFTWPLSAGNTVQTSFGGSHTGQHPNRLVCTPALSRLVTVKKHEGDDGDHHHGDDDDHHNGDDDHHHHDGDDDDRAEAAATFRVLALRSADIGL
jgi:hypothetical protein